MNTITADPSLRELLSALRGLTEVRDFQGTVLGYISPVFHESAEAYVKAATHFDPEEMKRRKVSNEEGHTTNEVLNRIASSEK
jgi:hypothetical protein